MKNRIPYQAMQKVAKLHNVPVEEVQEEIKHALTYVFPDRQIPAPDEFITFLCQVVGSYPIENEFPCK